MSPALLGFCLLYGIPGLAGLAFWLLIARRFRPWGVV